MSYSQHQLISIIVPIYNVEDYLKRCIDSILGQTYKNLEVILVDDGSPDKCGKICEEYKLIDSRIKVIHKKKWRIIFSKEQWFRYCNWRFYRICR